MWEKQIEYRCCDREVRLFYFNQSARVVPNTVRVEPPVVLVRALLVRRAGEHSLGCGRYKWLVTPKRTKRQAKDSDGVISGVARLGWLSDYSDRAGDHGTSALGRDSGHT